MHCRCWGTQKWKKAFRWSKLIKVDWVDEVNVWFVNIILCQFLYFLPVQHTHTLGRSESPDWIPRTPPRTPPKVLDVRFGKLWWSRVLCWYVMNMFYFFWHFSPHFFPVRSQGRLLAVGPRFFKIPRRLGKKCDCFLCAWWVQRPVRRSLALQGQVRR